MNRVCKLLFISALSQLLALGGFSQALHIYGGESHNVYLGCLNCNRYDSNSIWNAYGTYGSIYSSVSIWNTYGTYGSIYSSSSPWNSYSTDPPVIEDSEGNFYGYFTTNIYMPDRAEFDLVKIIYRFHELIRDDVSKWYDEIFY